MENKKEEFYTVEEVAEMLKVHDRTIRREIQRGKLKKVMIGNSLRIRRDDLEEYLEKNRS
jgi:excisionase family DNA binding protein